MHIGVAGDVGHGYVSSDKRGCDDVALRRDINSSGCVDVTAIIRKSPFPISVVVQFCDQTLAWIVSVADLAILVLENGVPEWSVVTVQTSDVDVACGIQRNGSPSVVLVSTLRKLGPKVIS